jgi:pyruvate dehydrogenase E2 component (dihydrolipoamide acetyltransferase)
MAEFRMPQLGADMTGGTLVAWHKRPGDEVKRGDIVAEVETEKGVVDVEIFTEGVFEKVLVEPGQTVPVGTALAVVREVGERMPGAEPPTTVVPPAQSPPSLAAPPTPAAGPRPPSAATAGGAVRLRISPAARELVRQLGIDPATIGGTGAGGAITREDVERTAATATPTHPSKLDDTVGRMRDTIAAAMSRSKREIPHYYLGTTIDLHRALSWLADENQKRPVEGRLLYGVLLLKAVALALREVPELNAVWTGDRAVVQQRINVGIAVSLRQGGLVAPAIHDTDRLALDELMERFRSVVNRARAGGLRSSELSDSTITLTSLGEQGVETVFPIIYPPQVAIVGFGKVVQRAWVADGQVIARPLVTATLSADHRVSDGHRGGLFLAAVDRLLQEPGKL